MCNEDFNLSWQVAKTSGKKKAHKHKLFGPVDLGTPRECPRDKPGFVPGTKWVCPRDKPRFSSYCTQRKPSLSLGQTQFVPGTFRGRRAADRAYVLKVYVPSSFPKSPPPNFTRFRDGETTKKKKWHVRAKERALVGGVPTTPDPNTSAKVSRYKWEAYRDTNWWCTYCFLPRGGHTFAKVSR